MHLDGRRGLRCSCAICTRAAAALRCATGGRGQPKAGLRHADFMADMLWAVVDWRTRAWTAAGTTGALAQDGSAPPREVGARTCVETIDPVGVGIAVMAAMALALQHTHAPQQLQQMAVPTG